MADTGLAKREVAQPALPRWGRAQIDLLKRTIAKGLTDDEFGLFTYVCRRSGLDPFLRQVHPLKFWDARAGEFRLAFVTGIDGFRLQSARTPGYAGVDPPEFEVDPETGMPTKARVTVYRFIEGEKCAFVGEARFAEFARHGKDGQLMSQWANSPFNQLAKCAEAQAHRKASPMEILSLNIAEEIPLPEPGGEEAGAGGFTISTLYEGTVTLYRLRDGKKRPGQIAVAVEGKGVLGPVGFWDPPEALKDHKPEEVPGIHVQVSYTEASGKRGQTYKNLAHLAVKTVEAGGDEEPGPEDGGQSPPAQGGQSPHPEQHAGPSDPPVDGARQPVGGEAPKESTFDYWMRMIHETKTLAALNEWWGRFGKSGGQLWDFHPSEREKLLKARDQKKVALGGRK